MLGWPEKLNELKLRDFPNLYRSLEIPEISSMSGYYQGCFVGPRWLRTFAGPALRITGLGGWWGKYFSVDGTATNLVQFGGKLSPRLPMKLVIISAGLDGAPGLALSYDRRNPFPWPYIQDELRQLEPGILLGMTYIKTGWLKRLSLPFLLQYQEQVDGL